MRVIIGLGNPGIRYRSTRHNVGFEAIDKLAAAHNIKLKPNRRFQAHVGEGEINYQEVILVKPMTYMNVSGQAVQAILNFYKLPPSGIVVIFDDVSLPVGDIRVRENGSGGGQKGMVDIINRLGTKDFPRVRIGVGQKPEGYSLSKYVLGRFPKKEKEAIAQGITNARVAVEIIIKSGAAEAMNEFNKKVKV